MTYATHRNCLISFLVAAAIIAASAGAAQAQGAVLSDDDDEPAAPEVSEVNADDPNRARLGVGIRLRNIRMPESLLELFIEDVPGGGSHFGIGLELMRRKGNFELAIGLEYDPLSATEGVWIDKGDEIPTDDPDYVEFDGFGWVSADISFIWQQVLHKTVALRYGAGLGLGVILGDVLRTDFTCTSGETSSCQRDPNAVNDRTPEEAIPPVFPIVNLLFGVQVRPTDSIAINFEVGLHTLPYLGTTVGYYF
jgi:hypothetical protein